MGRSRFNYDKLAGERQRHGTAAVRVALIESLGGDPADRATPCAEGVPENFDVARLMEVFLGREYVDAFDPKRGSGKPLLEGDGAAALALGDFSAVTGQLLITETHEGYEMAETVFTQLITSKATPIIDMFKIPGISMPSDEFIVIGEGEDYPNIGVNQDYQHRGALEKRGGIIQITRETIQGSGVMSGQILEKAKQAGRLLKQNVEKRVIDAVIDEGTGAKSAVTGGHRYHWLDTSYATYQASTPYVNLVSSNGLLDFTNINAAWLKLRGMKDPYSGEPITIKPKHLIVTPTNRMTAERIKHTLDVRLHSGGYAQSGNLVDTRSDNPIQAAGVQFEIIESQLLATRSTLQTDWWLGDIGKAIARDYLWELETEEAPQFTEGSFRRDVIFQHKVSLMDRVWTREPRALIESNA